MRNEGLHDEKDRNDMEASMTNPRLVQAQNFTAGDVVAAFKDRNVTVEWISPAWVSHSNVVMVTVKYQGEEPVAAAAHSVFEVVSQ